jgi:NAD(P)H dehydrogenase (quinone)
MTGTLSALGIWTPSCRGLRGCCSKLVAAVLPTLGRIHELTCPRSQDMDKVAREYSDALNREVRYSDILRGFGRGTEEGGVAGPLDPASGDNGRVEPAERYGRLADGVERVTGRPAMSVRDSESHHADELGSRRS